MVQRLSPVTDRLGARAAKEAQTREAKEGCNALRRLQRGTETVSTGRRRSGKNG